MSSDTPWSESSTSLVNLKNKIVDKINTLTPTANPRQLTFMSKALERVNRYLPEQSDVSEGYEDNEITIFNQSATPPMPINQTRAGLGSKNSPSEFGFYSQYSWIRSHFQSYAETMQANDTNLWHWSNFHTGARGGGVWGYWSTAQRNHCHHWSGGDNYCYFPTSGSPGDSGCYSSGSDGVGPMGSSTFRVGGERGFGMFWTHNCYQSTGRAPRHEMRNENYIVGNHECSDKQSYMVYDKQTIFLRSKRVQPGAGPNANFSQKSTNTGNINSFGTLSHNADRGELAVMNGHSTQVDGYNEAKQMFQVKLWKGVPTINIDTNLALYLDNNNSFSTWVKFDNRRDSDITPTWLHTAGADTTAWSGLTQRRERQSAQSSGGSVTWGGNTFHPTDHSGGPEGEPTCITDNKIVITNNGDLYYSVQHKYNHSLHITRRYRNPSTGIVDDTYYESVFVPEWNHENQIKNVSGIDEYRRKNIVGYQPVGLSATMLEALYLDTSCGRPDAGTTEYGTAGTSNGGAHFCIMSRNKKNVLLTSQYHQYGTGTATYLVDKRFNKWATMAYLRDVTHGVQWGPFGKEGFVCNFARNVHSTNPSVRLWIWRQNTNTGTWNRCDMSRVMAHSQWCNSNFPALVPNDY